MNVRSARMSDVAALAGVSTMTVSRVLNNSANVSDAVAQRVYAAVEKLRYQPNELARSLREQRTRQIGVIVPYLLDPFFATLAHTVNHIAKQHAYSVVISTTDESSKAELAEASSMLRRNIEGLIIIPAHSRAELSPLLAQEFQHIPIVTVDRPVEGSRFDSVLVENEAGGRRATEHLLGLGHKRIAFLGLSDKLYTINMRHRGYSAAMKAAGLPEQSASVLDIVDNTAGALDKLLSARKPPTALFCSNNLVTRRVLHSLQARGMHPPDAMALVGFDDFDTADLLQPGTTVISQPVELMGRTAAETLFARLTHKHGAGKGKAEQGRTRLFDVDLIVRGSCGAMPRTP